MAILGKCLSHIFGDWVRRFRPSGLMSVVRPAFPAGWTVGGWDLSAHLGGCGWLGRCGGRWSCGGAALWRGRPGPGGLGGGVSREPDGD